MYSVKTLFIDELITPSLTNPNGIGNEPDPTDVWLFTDPAVKTIYAKEEKLAALEQDICNYGMYQGKWNSDELEYRQEIKRLLNSKLLMPNPAFGHLSPHPTIYRATRKGKIQINHMNFSFMAGDDIVFAPWMERLNHPGLFGPLKIDHLITTTQYALLSEEFPQLIKLTSKDLGVLYKIIFPSPI